MIQEDFINIPLTLKDKEVIFVMDNINPESVGQESLVITNKGVIATINSDELDNLKSKYPDSDFYGFWSSLLISGVVEPNGLQIYYTSDIDGYYIYTKNSIVIETGVMTTNHIPSNYKLDIKKAREIIIGVEDIRLPKEKIKSAADVYRSLINRKNEVKRGLIRGSFIAVIILSIFAYVLDDLQTKAIDKKSENKTIAESLNQIFDNIKKTKNLTSIDQEIDLKKVLNIYNVSGGNFEIPKVKLDKKGKEALLHPSIPNPESELKQSIIIKNYNENKGWRLEW
jgi:hypothetical protein